MTCEPAKTTKTTRATCEYKESKVNCSERLFSGTVAIYECKPLYEDLSLIQYPYRKCMDGSWDYPPPNCVPGKYNI